MSVGIYETLPLPQEYNMASDILDSNIEKGRGDRVAIYFEGKKYTYNTICELTNKVGNVFKELGVEREQRVMVIIQDSPEWVASWLGAIKIGGVATHAYNYLNPDDYAYFINYVRPKIVVVDETTLDRVREGIRLSGNSTTLLVKANTSMNLSQGEHDFNVLVELADNNLDAAVISKNEIALWNWSGGTTGKPKAVPHMHHNFAVAFESFNRIVHYTENDVTLNVPKLFFHYAHDLGMNYILKSGGSIVLFSERTTPQIIFNLAREYKPTLLVNVPTMMRAMLQVPKEDRFDLSSIRINFSSGEALPSQLYGQWMEAFGVDIVEPIGSAEAYLAYIANLPGEKVPGSLGKVTPFVEAKIVDEEYREVPRGEEGFLMIRADSVGAGYHLYHEKSKETFLGKDWINTGDIFRQDEDDNFFFIGRSGDCIKVSGVWISPLEIEAHLQKHGSVKECAVLGLSDRSSGLMKTKAYVVLSEGLEGTNSIKHELTLFCKEKLAPHKFPRVIEFLPELPKTGQGKIDRFYLRERDSGLTDEGPAK